MSKVVGCRNRCGDDRCRRRNKDKSLEKSRKGDAKQKVYNDKKINAYPPYAKDASFYVNIRTIQVIYINV